MSKKYILTLIVFSSILLLCANQSLFAQVLYDTLPASKDAIVRSQNPTTNYGSNTTTETYAYNSCSPFDCPQYIRGLIDFDFSSIPRDAIILEATLKLYGISHLYSSSNASYLRRNTTTWAENSVTWNNKPTYSTGSTSIDRVSLAQSTSGTQDYNVNVRDMVNYWIKKESANRFGVTLMLQTETYTRRMSFGSKENGNTAKRPKLIIKYVLPVKVEINEVNHVDFFDPYSGYASITASGGAGTYTYNWSNGKTSSSCDSLTAGLYWVKVTDSLGNIGGRYIIIGSETDTVDVTLQPDSVLGHDAFLSSTSPTLIYESEVSNEFRAHCGTSGGVPFQQRSLLWFDINSLPSSAEILESNLILYGKDHQSTTQSNASYLARITSRWHEDSVWWNNAPSYVTADSVYLAQSSSATQNYTLDVTDHIQYFIENPQYNFGFLLRLIVQTQHARMVFHSSNVSNVSLRPKLELKILLPPTSITSLATAYTCLKEKHDGGYCLVSGNELKFAYNEEYPLASENNVLCYKIIDENRQIVAGVDKNAQVLISGSPVIVKKYGINKIDLDLTYLSLSSGNYYFLEVVNEKNEMKKLKFKYLPL